MACPLEKVNVICGFYFKDISKLNAEIFNMFFTA